jgi:ppGpp synthetase/RelA/SpoT-type nucleotidyltranferase
LETDEISASLAKYEAQRDFYETYERRLQNLIAELLKVRSVKAALLESRVKTPQSLAAKLAHPKYSQLEAVTDLVGLRVVVISLDDVDRTNDVLAANFQVDDFIKLGGQSDPAVFGYASCHTIVRPHKNRSDLDEWRRYVNEPAEVQVRTVLQHAWASISHTLDYKAETTTPQPLRRRLFQVSALLEAADDMLQSLAREATALQRHYVDMTATNTWASLELNAVSLLAAWDRLPSSNFEAQVHAAGIEIPRPELADQIQSIQSFVALAAAATIRDLVGVHQLMASVPVHFSVLKQIAIKFRGHGAPLELPAAEVLQVLIIIIHPELADHPAVSFDPRLRSAISASLGRDSEPDK